VADAAVVGEPDELRDEIILAYIVAKARLWALQDGALRPERGCHV